MRRAARVAFVSSCVRGGGAGWSLLYLLKHLDRARIEPMVVVPEPGIYRERFRELGLRVLQSRVLPERTAQQRFSVSNRSTRVASVGLNLADSLRFVPELASLLRREAVDLVYCNNMMVEPLGALGAQVTGTPAIVHVRNIHADRARALFYSSFACLPAVRRVITNSRASAAPYRRAAGDKLQVVYNGVDLQEYGPEAVARGEFRRELGIDADAIVVGFTGNLIPRKGVDVLIRAAARALGVCPRLHFIAVGRVPIGMPPDYLTHCQGLAERLGVADRFTFAGFRPDVRPAVADFDVLALPSREEPFGRSIIEAMALGTPVVGTRVGGIVEILREGDNGLLVAAGDDAALADAVVRLAQDVELRRRLAQRARREVLERFDAARLAERLQSVMLEVVSPEF